jgi:hypothetical protein
MKQNEKNFTPRTRWHLFNGITNCRKPFAESISHPVCCATVDFSHDHRVDSAHCFWSIYRMKNQLRPAITLAGIACHYHRRDLSARCNWYCSGLSFRTKRMEASSS